MGCGLNPAALKRKKHRNNAPSCFVRPSTSQILTSWEASSNSSTCACTWAGCSWTHRLIQSTFQAKMHFLTWYYHPSGSYSRWACNAFISCSTKINYNYNQFTYNCHERDSITWRICHFNSIASGVEQPANTETLTLIEHGRPCVCRESPQEAGGPWESMSCFELLWDITEYPIPTPSLRADRFAWMYIMHHHAFWPLNSI